MTLKVLRNLAKSNKWQIIYNRAKELGTIRLFNNDTDFSKAQILFLYYLELYASLYRDLSSHEPYISEDVINDEIRCDAYIFWRSTRKYKEEKAKSKNPKKGRKIDNKTNIPHMVFHRKKVK